MTLTLIDGDREKWWKRAEQLEKCLGYGKVVLVVSNFDRPYESIWGFQILRDGKPVKAITVSDAAALIKLREWEEEHVGSQDATNARV